VAAPGDARGPVNGELLVLDAGSALPPYEQIVTQLRARIAFGFLHPGQPLPSVRQLARDLGVAPNTIARSYDELERDGWVATSPRRGVVVAQRPPSLSPDERVRRLEEAVTRLLVTAHTLDAGATELHAEIDRQLAAGP